MGLVDSHCHLQDKAFDADRGEVLARALQELDWLVVVGNDLPSSREALALTGERVYATVGIHPHEAAAADAESLSVLRALAAEPGVVALGETGLDYYYDRCPREKQRVALRRQLELAQELALPVIIHCRDAEEDMAAILEDAAPLAAGGVMHCFSGDGEFARACMGYGLDISFAGNVTFKKAVDLRDAARHVPLDRLLVETDCPYLAPVPKRGKRCEPQYVKHTAALLAETKGVPLEELAAATTANARRLFRVEG